jgi:hypothetical protein
VFLCDPDLVKEDWCFCFGFQHVLGADTNKYLGSMVCTLVIGSYIARRIWNQGKTHLGEQDRSFLDDGYFAFSIEIPGDLDKRSQLWPVASCGQQRKAAGQVKRTVQGKGEEEDRKSLPLICLKIVL